MNPPPLPPVPPPSTRPPSHALAKGCGVATVGTSMLVGVPLAALLVMVHSCTSDSTTLTTDLVIPFLICSGSFAIYKILTAGARHEKPLPEPAPQPPLPLTADGKQAELFHSLPKEMRTRHVQVTEKCARLQKLAAQSEDPETKAQLGPGLEKLQWLHLKFLLAREHLLAHSPSHLLEELRAKIAALTTALSAAALTDTARQSKESTLAMTSERLRNLESRSARLTEIESDLERIESQLDLSLERAALQSTGRGDFTLHLAERMVDGADLFGSSLPFVQELDSHFAGSLDASSFEK